MSAIISVELIEVPIASIDFTPEPGKMRSPVVVNISRDIDAGMGILQEPTVRKRGDRYELGYGKRRLFAAIRSKLEFITVKLVECSDEMFAMMRAAENANRSHDAREQGESWEELVALRAKVIEEREEAPEPPAVALKGKKGKGRKKGTKAKAREELARERGVSPESIRKGEQRERARQEVAGAALPEAATFHETVARAIESAAAVEVEAEQATEWRNEPSAPLPWPDPTGAGASLTSARDALSIALTKAWEVPPATELRKAIGHALELANGLVPAGVCPYCEGAGCAECGKRGWLAEDALREASKAW